MELKFHQQLVLTVIDKLLIGLLIAIAGFWLNRYLETFKGQNALQNELLKRLMEKRRELDEDPNLLYVVAFLREEQRFAKRGEPLPTQPKKGSELRALPRFLEPLRPYLLMSPRTPKDAFNVLGEEILLCHRSKQLWVDEESPYSDTWWSGFKKLAVETEKQVGSRFPNIHDLKSYRPQPTRDTSVS